MPHVRANGIDVHYTAEGNGPPLVLLHGASSSALTSTGPKPPVSWIVRGGSVEEIQHFAKQFAPLEKEVYGESIYAGSSRLRFEERPPHGAQPGFCKTECIQ